MASLETLVLRVSIHCHGCKKKVRRVLSGVEGVHEVKVDAQQHKVTVTGTVDADTLVRRLNKSGKQALPWHHEPAAANKAVEATPQVVEATPQGGDGAKDEAADESSEKKPEKAEAKEQSVEPKKGGGDSEAAESKAKGAEPTKEATAMEAGNDEGDAKKTKDASETTTPVAARSLLPPAPYYAPQPVMSYHTAQPRSSVSSYYTPQPVPPSYPMQQQPPHPAAAYPMQHHHQHQMKQWSPSYLQYTPAPGSSYYHDTHYSPAGTHAAPTMTDSYRLFDDENPNSCTVM